eukprot:3742144-Pyramimonas_sp.AAC.1
MWPALAWERLPPRVRPCGLVDEDLRLFHLQRHLVHDAPQLRPRQESSADPGDYYDYADPDTIDLGFVRPRKGHVPIRTASYWQWRAL